MTFPTAYTRAKDFTTEAGGATDHGNINAELDDLGAKFNAVLTELQAIQRSDSKLANGAVHKDTFDAAALALIASTWTPKATWLTATAYVIGDVVDHDPGGGAVPYVCTVDHTSGTFATDLTAGNWTQIGTSPSSLTITPFGESLIDDADGPTALSTLGLSANGKSLVTAANYAAMRTLLSLVVGTDVLAPNGDGSALTNLPSGAAPVGSVISGFAASFTGYLLLDGKTIGSAASSAAHANAQYEALFKHLWNAVADAEAPVSGGRGASDQADWDANKTMTLPDGRGRYLFGLDNMGGTSAGRITDAEADKPGGSLGGETKTITANEMPGHTHAPGTLATSTDGFHGHTTGGAAGTGSPIANGQSAANSTSTSSAGDHSHTLTGASASTGSGNPLNILPPGLAMNYHIKF